MKHKIIIFDLDGVLFDSIAVAARGVADQYPGITEEMQRELLVGNFHEELIKLTVPKRIETEEEKAVRQLEYSNLKAASLMYDGMRDLLVDLHTQGYILALNTSAWEKNCFPMLQGARIQDLFDFLGTAEVSKSKVEKFRLIKEKYDTTLHEMLFVTDTLGDIREADKAQVSTVGVTWGAHDETYFNREPHENLIGVVYSVDELEVFIRKWPLQ